MRYYRHSNGSGKKYNLAEVCERTVLDRKSFAGDNAVIVSSLVIASAVQGDSVITHSVVERSKIGKIGSDDRTILSKAIVEDSTVMGSFIRDARIMNCILNKGVFVTGVDTICRSIELDAPIRIGEGEWDGRAPRYVTLKNELADITVTESIDGKAFIGCTAKKMGDWIKKRDMWAKAVGWDKNITDYLKQTFEMWLDTPYG